MAPDGSGSAGARHGVAATAPAAPHSAVAAGGHIRPALATARADPGHAAKRRALQRAAVDHELPGVVNRPALRRAAHATVATLAALAAHTRAGRSLTAGAT